MGNKMDLIIVAAGVGSRMGKNVPKALLPIQGIPNLIRTAELARHHFNRIFVVINTNAKKTWTQFNLDLEKYHPYIANITNFIEIESGLGDGHALIFALDQIGKFGFKLSDEIVICWGDAVFPYKEIFQEIKEIECDSGVIPVIKEKDPYVTILTDSELNAQAIDSSKQGERHPTGFHDQSIFKFKTTIMIESLLVMHNCFFKGGRYITSNSELHLLYLTHYLFNIDKPLKVYETQFPALTYNTQEELDKINKIFKDINE